MKLIKIPLTVASILAFAPVIRPDVIGIDFELNPVLAAQPSDFNSAGAIQTYSQPGDYSITGGVALGNPNFLAAFPTQGSAPNLYGTTDIASPTLLDAITLDFPLARNVTSVTGILFNGQPIAETYVINFYSGLSLINTINTPAIPDSSDVNGYFGFNFAMSALPITRMEISTPNAAANGWDFFVDDIAATTSAAVPEAASLGLVGSMLTAVTLSVCLRRKR